MLRNRIKGCCSRSLQVATRVPVRSQSSGEAGRRGGKLGKVAIIATGATFGLLGASTALAKYDPSFRRTIEQNIPYSDTTLSLILGPSPPAPAAAAAPPSKPQAKPAAPVKTEAPSSLLQKKLDRDAKRDPVPVTSPKTAATTTTSTLPAVPPPLLDQPTQSAPPAKHAPSPNPVSKVTEGDRRQESKPLSSSSSSSPESSTPEGLNKMSGMSSEFPKPAEASSSPTSSPSRDFDLNSLPDNVRDKVNQEMRDQLKLQLSAYNDYLHEQLRLQQDELSRMHAIESEERVLEEKMRYQRELAGSIVRLRDVEQVLQVRERLDREEAELKQIWFLCQQMNDCLKSNPAHGIQPDPMTLLNDRVLPVLERIANNEDASPLVRLAVASIREKKELLERGIYTEDALIDRFDKVNRVCKRVSLIGDEGGSLWRFLLSYVTPSLLFDTVWRIPVAELEQDVPVNTSTMDTFSILARVRYHLSRRNLEMSLRYANQLRGEPRKVAIDWIRDVRNHLEIRQASTLIQAQASAVSLKTFPSSS